jgi:hypothetical protein
MGRFKERPPVRTELAGGVALPLYLRRAAIDAAWHKEHEAFRRRFRALATQLQAIHTAWEESVPLHDHARQADLIQQEQTLEFISIKLSADKGEDEPGIIEGTAESPHPIADAHLP